MRLNEFHNPAPAANQTPEEAANIIRRDCQPFLAATDGLQYCLYRGIRPIIMGAGQILHKAMCPIGRKPTDSSRFLHLVADKWFHKTTGIAFRSNAIFCTGNKAEAVEYGTCYIMIPIGNFDYCWSPFVEDMYRRFDRDHYHSITTDDRSESALQEEQRLQELFSKSGYRSNISIADFRRGIGSGSEMMIHCDHYYFLKNYSNETNQVLGMLNETN